MDSGDNADGGPPVDGLVYGTEIVELNVGGVLCTVQKESIIFDSIITEESVNIKDS